MPPSSVSLSPSSCASLSSSPCNFLFSLCSPHNQVFFMLFSKVSCESVPRSYSVSLFFTFLPPFHSFSIFPMSRLEEMCPCQRKCFYLWSIAIHSAGLYVLDSTDWQFNTLLYTLRPVTFGSQYKSDCDRLHFSSLQLCNIFLCIKDAEKQPCFDLYHVIIDSRFLL